MGTQATQLPLPGLSAPLHCPKGRDWPAPVEDQEAEDVRVAMVTQSHSLSKTG